MAGDIRALLARHMPGDVRSVTELEQGTDHIAYEVNGDLIVRRRNEADGAARSDAVLAEAEMLAAIARWSTLPVPEPVLVDAEAGLIAYRKLPGDPLHTHPVPDPHRLAAQLGEFLGTLHSASLDVLPAVAPRDNDPMTAWLADAERDYGEIATQLPDESRPAIEAFLARTPPAAPGELDKAVFCHNDLGAEHILVEVATNTITGVIDWADAAIADPMHDLALILRDLGPTVLDRLLEQYPHPVGAADRQRLTFYARCSVLEEIVYGLRTGTPPYAAAGVAHLSWTFG